MIQVRNLTYSYPGSDKPVLKDISFEIKEGEIFGFLGPSGAGKSTTQKVLNGLLKGYRGSVEVNGTNLEKMDRSFYEKIGVAFEFPNLYLKLTALENLQLFASFFKSATRDPEELLALVGLSEDRDTRVSAFSKGMKMRLNFIRSLLNRPEVLFLDEPTAGLDPGNARIMKDIILDLQQQGVTIFLTTHHMDDAGELCQRLAFMVEGTLPVIDSTSALKLRHGEKKVRVSYTEDEESLTREFPMQGLANDQLFQEILKTREVLTIHTMEASLEEIFIQVTGQQLKQ
ncbi:MAG: ABC transporter ATP-binding protein [Bacteroidia bacterium]|nr:MAG: ABC transporter ATP-binding protein [Bacteroidia bacterium]